MTQYLDLADIQGNILQDFVSGYPKARFVFLRVTDAQSGRDFILDYRAKVTTALRWGDSNAYPGEIMAKKPIVAINLGITFEGFLALGLPTRTLAGMPPEFMDGMKARAEILGDQGRRNAPKNWDAVWSQTAHLMVGMNALYDPATGQAAPELEAETSYLKSLCEKYKLVIMSGHGRDNQPWQDCSALLVKNKATYKPVPLEHFGYIDGISNPVFEGQFIDPQADAMMAIGNGKILAKPIADSPEKNNRWAPLATGEFLLGHPDEAQEVANLAAPGEIMRNGTFLVYRKLHENVGAFTNYIDAAAQAYADMMGVPLDDAREILKAKMAGRWPDGVSVAVAPTIADWRAFQAGLSTQGSDRPLVDFLYGEDPEGLRCPVTAHMRRANPRDSFQGKSALNNRRRILRRGIPYGATSQDDTQEHGIIFLAMCANLSRQFEFVQQQWINYGLDANSGNDACPLIGNRDGDGDAKFLIPVDPTSGEAPFICGDIPQFVEMRGGDYFFLPSMTALRMIGMGTVDPT